MQTGYVASQHASPFYSPGIGNRAHWKQKEPDTKFDGDKVEWDDFLAHFEAVAQWINWTYKEKGLQLGTCLRGKAQRVLSSVSESEREDFEMLKTALRQHFSPPHLEKAFRSMFQQRKRETNEYLMDYGSEVMWLAQRAYPEFKPSVLDQVAREQFMRGLQDIEMKRFVDLDCSGGLDEAISLATQFESFELAEHGADLNRPLEAKCKNRLVQIQAVSEASSIESLLEKFSTAFEKRMEDLNQKITRLDAELDAMKACSKDPDPVGLSYKGRNSFYQP